MPSTSCARAAILLLAAGAAGLLPGSGCRAAREATGRPVVAVSVPPLAFFVERLAGDRVAIAVMIPPGANPASHQPALPEIAALAEAALYVKVGHPSFAFEAAWLDALLAERPELPVVDASAGAPRRPGDPHVWLAPRHARSMARNIHAALRELLPGEEHALDAGLAALLAEIDALDAEIRRTLAGRAGARFLVFHPAWSYFAEEYDLEQVAIEREGKEPDVASLEALILESRRRGIAVVFVQPQFNPRSAELVAREIGARVEILDPLARDWSDNLRRVASALARGATG